MDISDPTVPELVRYRLLKSAFAFFRNPTDEARSELDNLISAYQAVCSGKNVENFDALAPMADSQADANVIDLYQQN